MNMKGTFKYFVIAVLTLSLVSIELHAEISLRSLNIDIFMNKDGSAMVREEYILNIISNESMEKYNRNLQYLQKNDLQTWINNLQYSELGYHIGGKDAPITNLIITPSPLYGINYYTEEALAKIILDYNAEAPFESEDKIRGLFIVTNPKPRVTRYTLNHDGLNFDMTENGDIILPHKTKLTFHLDEGMYLLYAQPYPTNMNISRFSDIKEKELVWSSGILPKFTLIVEYEKPLEQEILDYIEENNNKIYDLFAGSEGIAVIIIIVVILISIVYWHYLQNLKKQK